VDRGHQHVQIDGLRDVRRKPCPHHSRRIVGPSPCRDGDRRRRRGGDTILFYDRDYQGDTAWRSSSYNDWWHERPDRAYPRWMAANQDCQRMWWSGGGWRC
jgi:hypothetical protein